jgi:hypothetical protein
MKELILAKYFAFHPRLNGHRNCLKTDYSGSNPCGIIFHRMIFVRKDYIKVFLSICKTDFVVTEVATFYGLNKNEEPT